MRTVTTILAIVAMLSSVNSATAGKRGSSCSRKPGYQRPVHNFQPGPVYGQPVQGRPVRDSPGPIDDGFGDGFEPGGEPIRGGDEELFDDEFVDDEFFDAPLKVVECEVQVQHPITFAWKTVKTFDDDLTAEDYKQQIEERFWVIYQVHGSPQPKFLEAASRRDASSKATALRSTGAKIVKLDRVQALVTEKPLQPIFDEPGPLDEAIAGFTAAKVPNELATLLGVWEAVTQNAEGQVNRLLLDLHADGTAELTVPTAGEGQVTIERDFAIEDDLFKLTDGESELVLGEVVSATADKVVLSRDEGEITFTRP